MDNFNDISVGDKVAIRSGFVHASYSIATVTKVNKQTFNAGGDLFYLKTGFLRGDSYCSKSAVRVTDKILRLIARQRALHTIRQCVFEKLDDQQIQQIAEIIKRPTGDTND